MAPSRVSERKPQIPMAAAPRHIGISEGCSTTKPSIVTFPEHEFCGAGGANCGKIKNMSEIIN